MASLIEAARAPDYPAEIVLVLSNRPDAAGLDRAREAGIPARAIDHKAFPDRTSFDAALQAELDEAGIELIVLAGFMRILTDAFVEAWTGRMINIHPSLLPLFKGTHTHERALEAGVRLHGCTVHYVVPELDAGPIVAQAAVARRWTGGESASRRRRATRRSRSFRFERRIHRPLRPAASSRAAAKRPRRMRRVPPESWMILREGAPRRRQG
jgi:formyltetrahydrofolate-dependent phosphoribosylglycinamide formyltransferase